ncbi:MmgE/PrpD family protein [Bordetella sp. BOR01]|uniref:MmgE/PrpD family protein n=1 Tax=Bordetella sp. BOR01 TaxID=2854779 RepID=UPI001C44C62D|nr:MmgE/PrpD family protein [Bordetella sp. BOR01]MBV7482206.1 MmgE/PrpD family protein [Bordetella sp. BOR01]
MAGLTETMSRVTVDRGLADFPPETVDKAKRVIADTFAVILSGAGSEVEEPLMRYLDMAGGNGGGSVPILGTARRAGPELSALINGTFGHALDFDDVLSMMPAHPSAIIVAALLADLPENPLDGRAFVEAYVIGVEVGARIAQGITVGHYGRGFHGTGTLGTFSALAALAKARRLDLDRVRIAFGIASSMASGVRRNFGTMTKPLHTGLAARNAVEAVRLALCGFTAAPDALEAKAGFYAAYGVEASNPQVAIDALAGPGILADPGIALKKFACCYASHRGMDGVLQLRARHHFTADDVVRLECRMPPGGMLVLTYPRPVTGLEGKFSLQYSLAAGVLDGKYSIWSFTDEAVRRPGIASLLDRISAFEDESCRDDDPLFDTRSSGGRGFVEVEVELRNGTRDCVRVNKAPGHPTRELSWDDIAAKFADCAGHARLDAGRAAEAFGMLRELENRRDLGALIGKLHH